MVFWKKKPSEPARATPSTRGIEKEEDDLVKWQKQFGIKVVNDKDIEAELSKLMGGLSAAVSPHTDLNLFGDEDDSDEEAKILRSLNVTVDLNSIQLSDDDNESDASAKCAKYELQGVIAEIQQTTTTSYVNDDMAMTAQSPQTTRVSHEEVHTMKLQALALKREGKIKEALTVFRQVKQLEAQMSVKIGDASIGSVANAPPVSTTTARNLRGTSIEFEDENDDVDVTDEDMENPEYLAQLAAMGLPIEHPVSCIQPKSAPTPESLQQRVEQLKVQALRHKRLHEMSEALQCMRQIKALESEINERQHQRQTAITRSVSDSTTEKGEIRAVDLDVEDVDIEVTEEDMNNPEYANELKALGLSEHDTNANTLATCTTIAMPIQRAIQKLPSMVDEDLIDEFEDTDQRVEVQETTTTVTPLIAQPLVDIPGGSSSTSAIESTPHGADMVELREQLHRTKLEALRLKRDGNTVEALNMMRRVKQIDRLITMKEQQSISATKVTTVSSTEETERTRRFTEVEQVLVRFGNDAMAQAKALVAIDRNKSAEWLAKRKEYGKALDRLRELRKNPHQEAPSYSIKQICEQKLIERKEIPEDSMHVMIRGIYGLEQMAGKEVFVKFNFGFPASSPHEGKTGTVCISSTHPFTTGTALNSSGSFQFKLSRGRGTVRLFEIKKAVFEVWRPGSMLRNPEMIARCYQVLEPLLTVGQIDCLVPFVGPNRKPVGGSLDISIRIRVPLRDSEYQTVCTEVLEIGEYPVPQPVSTITASSQTRPTSMSSPVPMRSSPNTVLSRSMSAKAMETTSIEIDDPHHVDLIVSYDVINEEMEKLENKRESIELSDRYDSLALKKQLLEIEMQTGKLTLEMYIQRLDARIQCDRSLCATLLKSNRRMDAARVLRRIKLMEKEVAGANAATNDNV